MPNTKNYWTTTSGDKWSVKREGSDRATSVHNTQAQAWQETQQRARTTGGEAFLQNQQGQIRERNTYGHDPRSVKG
ncbi:MAG TPA: DUF2188 domain-containing protein [Alphaproteobacteria bacterium]|nr:DUF2188 domain-containing protein [Alphaproteobacteria bacterium]